MEPTVWATAVLRPKLDLEKHVKLGVLKHLILIALHLSCFQQLVYKKAQHIAETQTPRVQKQQSGVT